MILNNDIPKDFKRTIFSIQLHNDGGIKTGIEPELYDLLTEEEIEELASMNQKIIDILGDAVARI